MTESPREPEAPEHEDAEERPEDQDVSARGGTPQERVERAVNHPPERR